MQSFGNFTLQHLRTEIWKKGKILESFQVTEKCILRPDLCSRRKISQLWGIGGLCISKNEEKTILKFMIFFVIFEKFDKFVILSGLLLLLRRRWMKYLADKTVMLCRCDKTMKRNHQLCYYIMLDTKNSSKVLIFGKVEFW